MEIYKNIFKGLLYPFYESVLMNRKTFSYYKQYKNNEKLSSNELKAIQFKKLKKLISFCYEHVPYYKNKWKEKGVHPDDIQQIEDLDKLPILTKQDIKNNYESLKPDAYDIKSIVKKTGGSTGVPLIFEISRDSYESRVAVAWRGYEWTNAEIGRRTAYVWGADFAATPFQKIKQNVYNRFFNRMILNTFDYTNDMESLVKSLNRFGPKVIVSYVNPLYELSKYIIENDIYIIKPDSIVTGAESLEEYQRSSIEKAFQCKVTNTYGCREVMLIAAECHKHNGLHINIDHLVVELINKDQYKDNQGEVILTDLSNYAMPIVRYKNGDLAIADDHVCDCGLNFPLLKRVNGRMLDVIRLESGKIIPGEFFPHLLKDIKGIDKYQIIQQQINKLDIKLVVNEDYEIYSEQYIADIIKNSFDDEIRAEYVYVDDIGKTESGKTRITISNLT